MKEKSVIYSLRVAAFAVVFVAGYVCGSITEQRANAQMGDLGSELLQRAAGSGGVIGSVAQLGTTITEMEKNVSGLQKNIDTLKKVKTALGGK
ncbi:hypothetical protein M1B72_02545 [Geomonas paludis]|uniref:Uncharacterized protein n=1 Tax=Geomonas paludis TaxID=2740185 RepID=A0A6V8N3I9_9BACT|nr:hypothetical protein [Geomonas paludis]UPU36603.1 hypothetical protein M1B72_02545 [Geomonas paludis]GFO65859.1 hypothetical protein GMPD_37780 [Geomonas paludis]